jgi:hypothetical protein
MAVSASATHRWVRALHVELIEAKSHDSSVETSRAVESINMPGPSIPQSVKVGY